MIQIDMDMPKCCNNCPFCLEDDQSRDYCNVNYMDIRYMETEEGSKNTPLQAQRHPNCPLKEVSTNCMNGFKRQVYNLNIKEKKNDSN